MTFRCIVSNAAGFVESQGALLTLTETHLIGSVFDDMNGNGAQDAGEYAIPGQHVWLDTNDDGFWEPGEPAATTDATGHYSFSNAAPGNYVVRYYAPPGFLQTTPAASSNVTLTGTADTLVDFGVTALPAISGGVFQAALPDQTLQSTVPYLPNQHVWLDLNNDGLWEPGESATLTDSTGHYSFLNLLPGTYVVRYYTPPTFVQTTPSLGRGQIVSLATTPAEGIDFGVR